MWPSVLNAHDYGVCARDSLFPLCVMDKYNPGHMTSSVVVGTLTVEIDVVGGGGGIVYMGLSLKAILLKRNLIRNATSKTLINARQFSSKYSCKRTQDK